LAKIVFQKKNLKLFAFILILIISTSTVLYIRATSITTTIENGSMVSTASYIVFREGSTYYARDGLTGAIDYSSSNASYIFLTLIHLMGTIGGTIAVKPEHYIFTSQLYIDVNYKNWKIVGEGVSDYYNTGTYLGGSVVFQKAFNGYLFYIVGTSGDANSAFILQDITLYGDWVHFTGGGIYIQYRGYWQLNNIRAERFEGDIIHIDHCYRARLNRVMVAETTNGYGVYIQNLGDSFAYDLESDCNTQASGKAALYIGTSVDMHFIGGHFEGYYGIITKSGVEFDSTVVSWSRSNNIVINNPGVRLIGVTCQYANINDEFSGDASAQVFVNSTSSAIVSISSSNIGTSPNSDYSVYADYYTHMESNTLGETVRVVSDCTIINSIYIPSIESERYNIIIGNIFFSPATITNTTGKNYMRGNYNSAGSVWIPDSTP